MTWTGRIALMGTDWCTVCGRAHLMPDSMGNLVKIEHVGRAGQLHLHICDGCGFQFRSQRASGYSIKDLARWLRNL